MRRRAAAALALLLLCSSTSCRRGTSSSEGTTRATNRLGTMPFASAGSSTSAAATSPTLGVLIPERCLGCGEVRPSRLAILGYSRGGFVFQEVEFSNVSWRSWGASRVRGSGEAFYTGPGETGAVTLVAFDLGLCDGSSVYQRLQWFPNAGSGSYFDACTGFGVGPGWP